MLLLRMTVSGVMLMVTPIRRQNVTVATQTTIILQQIRIMPQPISRPRVTTAIQQAPGLPQHLITMRSIFLFIAARTGENGISVPTAILILLILQCSLVSIVMNTTRQIRTDITGRLEIMCMRAKIVTHAILQEEEINSIKCVRNQ